MTIFYKCLSNAEEFCFQALDLKEVLQMDKRKETII